MQFQVKVTVDEFNAILSNQVNYLAPKTPSEILKNTMIQSRRFFLR